ncbi:non-ribosomal peptide synthetase [Kitasatospora sp. MMS16-BH015]|uniref:non-ribosomal peptide synthetase n=1 Tax=Kitasatospora sp. MMS16-BH015 TaxID=2018025 RepID=UPI000CA0DBCA|nr:non-ribosomal peptide synthetase [Kitasatospora sp. MMS16-BH015]AUG75710.1 non-ribosomal peptide synthetase [Kitasatospora sp. MMS16-BH015]
MRSHDAHSPYQQAEFTPVAVVGLAVRLPQADSAEALHRLLADGVGTVGAPSAHRLALAGLDPAGSYPQLAAAAGIEEFDREYFGITPAEAEAMDPHQRWLLQLSCAAVENAGYRVSGLRGGRTGVFLGAPRQDYARLVGEDDLVTMLGTAASALAGRVSYLLGLQGPAVVVDTGCSSAVVALHYACRELTAGTVDTALVGGASLYPVLVEQAGADAFPEVMATDGVCRAFDAAAAGTSPGEGGGVLLLKRLDRALADGDTVHAVLRGLAVNHNGSRSNGFSAPGLTAQVEVIEQAWAQAGIGLDRLTVLEAHGSGTRLGDMIEIEAVQRVLTGAGAGRHACAIGSVKSNLGHLGNIAGIAGLIKAVLGLRHRTHYPSINFEHPNPQLAAHGEPVRVSVETAPWTTPDGRPRVAGVSSLTLIGTNTHAVLEEAPERPEPAPATQPYELVTLSARSTAALRRQVTALREWLPRLREAELPDALFVLNAGRDDHPVRVAFPVSDLATLRDGLDRLAGELEKGPQIEPVGRRLVLVLGDPVETAADPAVWAAAYPAYAQAYQRSAGVPEAARHQYASVELLRAQGLAPEVLLGTGRGRAVARALRGELPLAEAWAEPVTAPSAARTRAVVARLAEEEPSAFLVLGEVDPAFGELVDVAGPAGPRHEYTAWPATAPAELAAVLATLYRAGITVDWDRRYAGQGRRRIELPGYSFEPTRCWPEVRPSTKAVTTASAPVEAGDPVEAVAEVFGAVLRIDGIDAESDYFDLGGNSILGLSVLERLNRRYGLRLTLPVLYEYSTVAALAELIRSQARTAAAPAESIVRLTAETTHLPSHGQEALWFLDQLTPDVAIYNVPHDMHLRGPVDVPALRRALAAFERRHEVLRTRYLEQDGKPLVALLPVDESELEVVDLTGIAEETERTAAAEAWLRAAAAAPMVLSDGPLYRKLLVKTAEDDHTLLLVAHHSVYDGWTPAVLDRDLWELYRAELAQRPAELPELPISYLDFAAWQRERLTGEHRERLLRYWRGALAGVTPSRLPHPKPRPERLTGQGEVYRFTVPAELMDGLKELSAAQRGSLFMTMLTVLKVLLLRYSGEGDLTVATTTAGRSHPDVLELIGYFNNAVPLRTKLDGDLTFRQALARVRRTVIDGLDHDELPFAMLVADQQPERDPSRHPIFQIAYIHQNIIDHVAELAPGLTYRSDRLQQFGGLPPGTAKWDLSLTVCELDTHPELTASFEYSLDLFDQPAVERLTADFLTLIRAILAEPDAPICGLPLLDEAERQARLAIGHGPADAVGPIGHVVARGGASVALAARLAARGVGAGTVVAGPADGLEGAVALAAVVRLGAVYVPWDTGASFARQAAVLEQAGPALLLSSAGGPLPWPGPVLDPAEAGSEDTARGVDAGTAPVVDAVGGAVALHGLLVPAEAVAGYSLAELIRRAEETELRPTDGAFVLPGLPYPIAEGAGETGDPEWLALGRTTPGTRLYVLDPALGPVPAGVTGELWLGGPVAALGYHRDPAGTERDFRADPHHPGGRLLRTGRAARIDAAGVVQLRRPAPVAEPAPVAVAVAAPASEETAPDELETALIRLWAGLLDREPGRHENFFDLGGHSLLAMTLLGKVQAQHGVRLPAAALFDHPTPAGLAEAVRTAGGRTRPASIAVLQPRGEQPPLVCLHPNGENTLAFHAFARQFAPDTPLHGLRAERPDPYLPADARRTRLAARARECATAIRGADPQGPYRLLGWEYGAVLAAETAALLRAEGGEVTLLGLVDGPETAAALAAAEGLPARVFRSAPSDGAADGVSAPSDGAADGVSAEEETPAGGVRLVEPTGSAPSAEQAGAAPTAGEPARSASTAGPATVPVAADLAAPLREHAAALAAAVRAELERVAAQRRSAAGRTELYPDRFGDGAGGGAATVRPFKLGPEIAAVLGYREGGPVPVAGVVAAVGVLLARLTGEPEVMVGLRETGSADCRPVRLDTGVADLPTLVRQAEQAVAAARAERAPAAGAGRHPLVSVAVDLAEEADGAAELVTPQGRLDVVWRVRAGAQGLSGAVLCDAGRFEPRSAKRLVTRWRRLLAELADGVTGLTEPDLVEPAERQSLVHDWNDTATDLGEPCSLAELVGRQAAATPERTAVEFGEERLSYRELDRQARALAAELRERGVGPEQVVGVCAERSPELVVGLLGVLYAGAAYLPLDPEYPAARLAYLLADSGARLVLTGPGAVPLAEVEQVELKLTELVAEPAPATPARPDGAAYVIYTSGSTGQPKGVTVPHRGAVNRIRWAQHRDPLGAEDRVLQKTAAGFDVSVWEFFWPLSSGAVLVLAAPGVQRDAFRLAELIERARITTVHFVPSMLRVFLPAVEASRLTGLRRVVCSGEALPPETRAALLAACPADLLNLYGPTEASVDVSVWDCRQEHEGPTVPIGRPIANLALYVLDGRLLPCPVGVPGELYLGGEGLARGYLGRPGLTATRFVASPFGPAGARLYRTGDRCRVTEGGVVEYLGRLDDQVKLRGFRIEPGEIETALTEHPGVTAAAVVVQLSRAGDQRLVAHLVGERAAETEAQLRTLLAARLPAHMVPAAFVWHPSLPVGATGKLDRRALAERAQG